MVAAVPLEEKALLTEEEYAALSDAYEIIDGEPVEREPMSSLAVKVRDNIYKFLDAAALTHETGYVFGDGFIYLVAKKQRGIKGAYIPDVSFVRKGKIPAGWDISKNFPGAPDLAVEVVSPNDLADKLQTKVRGYLERGTEQVWVIFPETREILVYRQDQPDLVRAYRGETKIDLSAFFPGVEITLDEVFRLPTFE